MFLIFFIIFSQFLFLKLSHTSLALSLGQEAVLTLLDPSSPEVFQERQRTLYHFLFPNSSSLWTFQKQFVPAQIFPEVDLEELESYVKDWVPLVD